MVELFTSPISLNLLVIVLVSVLVFAVTSFVGESESMMIVCSLEDVFFGCHVFL